MRKKSGLIRVRHKLLNKLSERVPVAQVLKLFGGGCSAGSSGSQRLAISARVESSRVESSRQVDLGEKQVDPTHLT